jgi:hypothetical protein
MISRNYTVPHDQVNFRLTFQPASEAVLWTK